MLSAMLHAIRAPVIAAAALAGVLAAIPAAASAAPPRCHTADLSARVGAVDAGAGQRSAPLVLTNTSGHTCRTEGYVGLQLATSSGQKLPTSTSRLSGPTPVVTLKPGQKAVTQLQWTVVATGREPADGACEGTPSDLLVIAPDETTQTSARWRNGPVCAGGRFVISPLKKKG